MTADEIKTLFLEKAQKFNRSRGVAAYRLSDELIRLSTLHFELTGDFLKKPPRSD